MNSKVKEYLDTAKAKEKAAKEAAKTKERDQLLISLGLIDEEKSKKVYSDVYIDGYSWDEKEKKYYHISQVPIEVTDEEYAEIVKYAKKDNKNNKTKSGVEILLLIASIFLIISIVSFLFLEWGEALVLIFSFIFPFALVLVFIKMSKNLQEIKDKIDAIEKDKK